MAGSVHQQAHRPHKAGWAHYQVGVGRMVFGRFMQQQASAWRLLWKPLAAMSASGGSSCSQGPSVQPCHPFLPSPGAAVRGRPGRATQRGSGAPTRTCSRMCWQQTRWALLLATGLAGGGALTLRSGLGAAGFGGKQCCTASRCCVYGLPQLRSHACPAVVLPPSLLPSLIHHLPLAGGSRCVAA